MEFEEQPALNLIIKKYHIKFTLRGYPRGYKGTAYFKNYIKVISSNMIQNSNDKGKLTEALVLAYILNLGYSVAIPFGDKNRYDQIWDINGKLLRVQIKTARLNLKEKNPSQNQSICFNCKAVANGKTHKYSKSEIDYFATYWGGKVYLVPVTECSVEKILRFTSSQPNQSSINWAKNYEVEHILEQL